MIPQTYALFLICSKQSIPLLSQLEHLRPSADILPLSHCKTILKVTSQGIKLGNTYDNLFVVAIRTCGCTSDLAVRYGVKEHRHTLVTSCAATGHGVEVLFPSFGKL